MYQLPYIKNLGMLHPGAQTMLSSLFISFSLFSLASVCLCSSTYADFILSAGKGRKVWKLQVYIFFSSKLQDSDWLSLSHMIFPEPIRVCQGMSYVLWLRKAESWAVLLVGQRITHIPNRVLRNEGWIPQKNLKKANGKVCWADKNWPLYAIIISFKVLPPLSSIWL